MIRSSNSMPNKAIHHIIAIEISKLAEIIKKKDACDTIEANQMHFNHRTKSVNVYGEKLYISEINYLVFTSSTVFHIFSINKRFTHDVIWNYLG